MGIAQRAWIGPDIGPFFKALIPSPHSLLTFHYTLGG